MAAPLSPARLLALSFGGMIATGTALLMLPVSAAPGVFVTPLDALFTATSAVCVTGLIVVDTSTAWSPVGHAVLLLLMQAGGLGYMTFSTLLAAALGRRVGMHSRATLQEGLNLETREELLRFAGVALRATLAIELVAALALALWWAPTFGAGRAAWLAVFHAVSAFNNAGFSLFPDNLMRFRGDVVVNLVVVTLIILGGLGFVVLQEIVRVRLRHRWSVQTKLVLGATGLLTAGGTAAMLLLEARNPATLGSLGWGEALLAAFFQAVSPRTAGFNTIDIGAMTPAALFIVIALMFIGASPGGTGGGVKTTTFGVTVFALLATVRGQAEPVVFGRRIVTDVVARAFFISLTAFLAMNAIAASLLIVEGRDLLRTLFEATSAFGTVGLSMGLPGTPLSLAAGFGTGGKLLLVLMMFLGRVGPLTVAVALAGRTRVQRVTYPEGRVLIG